MIKNTEIKIREGNGNSIKQLKFEKFCQFFNADQNKLNTALDTTGSPYIEELINENYNKIIDSYVRHDKGEKLNYVGARLDGNEVLVLGIDDFIDSLSTSEFSIQWYNKKRGTDIQIKLSKWVDLIKRNNKSALAKKIDNEYSITFKSYNFFQKIIDGPPGTGKSYEVKKRYTQNTTNYERVTFYADYEYHNFVGSILPVLNNGNISYEFVPGPFTKILNEALSNPLEPYYLIIEELTRGNASGIFGDIFQLLDRENGGWSEYPVSNSNIFSSLSENNKSLLLSKFKKEAIALPPNLSIICTINSSDQNVYPLDTAFKRRFIYEIISTEVTDEEQLKELKYVVKIGKEDYIWHELYTSLNKFFLKEMELKEDKQIGPYFIKEEDNNIMVSKLALYLWNDIHSIHKTASVKLFADEIFTLSKLNNLMNDESEDVKSIFSKQFLEFWDENHVQN